MVLLPDNSEPVRRYTLRHGDALDTLKDLAGSTADLIYLDPGSARSWARKGSQGLAAAPSYSKLPPSPIESVLDLAGEPALVNWSRYLYAMFLESRRLLKQSGSVVLQVEAEDSACARLLLDVVMGRHAFRNEIVWHHGRGNRYQTSRFPVATSRILFYARSRKEMYFDNRKRPSVTTVQASRLEDQTGVSLVKPDMIVPSDVWRIPDVGATSKERFGLAGQDPIGLADRLIRAIVPPDGMIVDPFCGTGTTLIAAHHEGRRWYGIDSDYRATTIVKHRALTAGIPSSAFAVDEELPDAFRSMNATNDEGATFAFWALGRLGARPSPRFIPGRGFDGQLVRKVPGVAAPVRVMIQVKKSGDIAGVVDVDELREVLEQENADLGLLVTSTGASAAAAHRVSQLGSKNIGDESYPLVQIVDKYELAEGRTPVLPGKEL
jgi:hypothetical protein